MANEKITFPCVKVTQPIGTFYVGSVPARDVIAIAHADIRRIEERDIEKIVGIQRELRPNRVKQIKQYVTNIDATFPTSVLLAVDSEHARYNESRGTMSIDRSEKVARVIDGQHRIAGLEEIESTFELNVTIFVDMELEDQAMTFATINLEQTKVSKSLAFDLYEFQKARSPQKTCHNIARLLNTESDSPLKSRIKILGRAVTGEPYEFITQATFVTKLMAYISSNPMKDRDLIRRGRKVPPAGDAERERLFLRDLFIEKRDADIAKIVWNLFTAVAQRWPEAWYSTERGDILNRTQGFSALMRFLGPLYRSLGADGSLPIQAVRRALNRIQLPDSHFTTDNYAPGTSGESALFQDLRQGSGIG